MKRDRNDVLRSITALLSEVSRVSAQINPTKVNQPSSIELTNSSYLTRQQVAAISEAVLKAATSNASAVQRRHLDSLIASSVDTAIQAWMNQSLKSIVDEVVAQQLAGFHANQRRAG